MSESKCAGGAVVVDFDSLFDLRTVLGIKRLNFVNLCSWLASLCQTKKLIHEPILATRDGILDGQGSLARDIRAAGFVVTRLDPRVKEGRKDPDPIEQSLTRIDRTQCSEVVLLTTRESHVALVRALTANGVHVRLVTTEVPCRRGGQWRLASEVADLIESGSVQAVELASNIARICSERMHQSEHREARALAAAQCPRKAAIDFSGLGPQELIHLLAELKRLEARFPRLRIRVDDT